MIDPIHGAGPGSASPRSEPLQGRRKHVAGRPASAPPRASAASEFQARLAPIAARLETLQQSLTALRASGGDEEQASRILRDISAAQVAVQNVLSTDTNSADPLPDDLAPAAGGHDLEPGNVLQLLE